MNISDEKLTEQLREQRAHSDLRVESDLWEQKSDQNLDLLLLEKFSFVNSIFCSSFPSFSSFSSSSFFLSDPSPIIGYACH